MYALLIGKRVFDGYWIRKMISVSPVKLQMIRNTGMLTFAKIGGNIYYDRDELTLLFENNKISEKKGFVWTWEICTAGETVCSDLFS